MDVSLSELWEMVMNREAWCSAIHGVAESCLQCGRPRFNPWVGKIPLEKEMATHSSVLAWRIPWTEEPGGLQSMGSQELGMTERLTHRHLAPGPTHFFIT